MGNRHVMLAEELCSSSDFNELQEAVKENQRFRRKKSLEVNDKPASIEISVKTETKSSFLKREAPKTSEVEISRNWIDKDGEKRTSRNLLSPGSPYLQSYDEFLRCLRHIYKDWDLDQTDATQMSLFDNL